jgi:hypothetical protein
VIRIFKGKIHKMYGHNSMMTIEKLEGRKNYYVWKTQMKFYLVHEELWDLVSTEPAAEPAGAADRKRDSRALSKIGLLLQEEYNPKNKDSKSGSESALSLQHRAWNRDTTKYVPWKGQPR